VCDDCAKIEEVFPCQCGVDDIVEATLQGCTTFSYQSCRALE
jgi:putative N-acetylmannosamine-6-phosphate epimerase